MQEELSPLYKADVKLVEQYNSIEGLKYRKELSKKEIEKQRNRINA